MENFTARPAAQHIQPADIGEGWGFKAYTGNTCYHIVGIYPRNTNVLMVDVYCKMNDGSWLKTNTTTFRRTHVTKCVNEGRWNIVRQPTA